MEKTSEWLNSFSSSYRDQISALVSERKSKDKKSQTISITGGKGGVGKTSISLKLARELAATNAKVLLIDCDYNLANTAIKLGLPIDNTFYSLVTAQKNFDECLHKEGKFHLLSACNGSVELFDTNFKFEELIIDIISSHEAEYDYILLDCPAGLSREALTLNAYCDHRVVVVTPDRASITDSYSLIKVLNKKFGVRENHLMVNMLSTTQQFERVVKTLSETIENYLGCRTKILGGLRRLDVKASQFDQYFLSAGKNIHHKTFLKAVKKLSEELSRPKIREATNAFESHEMMEQEVH